MGFQIDYKETKGKNVESKMMEKDIQGKYQWKESWHII